MYHNQLHSVLVKTLRNKHKDKIFFATCQLDDFRKTAKFYQTCWYKSIIPASYKIEAGGLHIQGCLDNLVAHCLKIKSKKNVGDLVCW